MADEAIRVSDSVDAVYRSQSRRVLATLIRLLGDFELAEEALHNSFAAALEQWPRDGCPPIPEVWLVSTGRFKAIDDMRRRARFDASLAELARQLDATRDMAAAEDQGIEDDRLRLIFICCHPALPPDAKVAVTLREMFGFTTEEIARLSHCRATRRPADRAGRRRKSATRTFPIRCPREPICPERLDAVLHVMYLVFNEGYSASSGEPPTRPDLSAEGIRLGRLLLELLPEPE